MKGEELPVIVFSSLSRLTLPWVPEVFRCWLCLYCDPREKRGFFLAARVRVLTAREKTSGTQGSLTFLFHNSLLGPG